MRRTVLSASLIGLGLLLPATAAGAAGLTRIETRPYYGAVITIEQGVRVFRPLPPHRHIIINPGGKTPLNLSFEENNVTVYERHVIEADVGTNGYAGAYAPGIYGGFIGNRRHPRFRHHHRRPGGYLTRVPRSSSRGAR